MLLMTQPKRGKGRPPARPEGHVPGQRSGVPIYLRVEPDFKNQLLEALKHYNDSNNLNLELQQFAVKLMKDQMQKLEGKKG